MHSAIRFSHSRSESTNSSMQVASAAAEPMLPVSSIARDHEDGRDSAQSVVEPSVRQPTSASSIGSAFSQRSLRGGSPASAAVAGEIRAAAPTASSSYASNGSRAEALLHHDTGNPRRKLSPAFRGSARTRSSEESNRSTRGGSGSSPHSHLDPAAPPSQSAAQPPHPSPSHFFPDLPWIPPPPIYGTPLPDSSNMNPYYAHYYDTAAAGLRAPFCYPEDVPRAAGAHHRDVSGAEWPTPSDLPLPSTFPMPPHLLPRPAVPMASPSAAGAAAGDAATPLCGWAMPPPPLLYPPPPPPWWLYGPPPLPLSASSSSSSASSTGSRSYSSSSSQASVRSAARPSRRPLSSVARRRAVPAGSVVTPVAVAPRRGAGGCHAGRLRSVAPSASPYAATHTAGTGRAARPSAGSSSAVPTTATTTPSATTASSHSAQPQRVERRVYASDSSGSNVVQRAANRKGAPVSPPRTNAAPYIRPDPSQVHDVEAVQERDDSSPTARMQHALSTAEAYLHKMESLYRRFRDRYEEVIMLPERLMEHRGEVTADEEVAGRRHPRVASAATTGATRGLREKRMPHPPQHAFPAKTRLPSTAPAPHARRAVSSTLSALRPPPVEPSLRPSSSSSTTSAASLRHELQLLESQWQRLEELKRHGGIGTATAVAPPVSPSPSAVVTTMSNDHFTHHRFLQLIQNRKQLLMSAA
ncbi:hypothetical protein JIQ42_05377 [Leishmania sp. Namibia]|uniref:hypothetical protein n=1 Tax=Leishmania sp. Namibia TaxID=2802991 RepID=UPI001B3FB5B4|nr:hypothetical protein JIQ42_05377 [Leishmania sp. Namibia]